MKRSELKNLIRDLVEEEKKQGKTVEESFGTQPKIRTIINSIRSESRDAKDEIDFILEREGTTFNSMSKIVEQEIADMLEEDFPELWSETIIDQTTGIEESFIADSKKEFDVFEEGLVTNLAKTAGTVMTKVVNTVQGVGSLLKKGMEMAKTFKQTAIKRYDQVQRQIAAKGKAATWIRQMLKPTIKEGALTITELNKLVYDPKKVVAALADEESGMAASYIIANFVTATTQMAESIQALKGLLTEANTTETPVAGNNTAPAAPGTTPAAQPGVQQAGKNYGTRKMAEESKNNSRFFKYGNK